MSGHIIFAWLVGVKARLFFYRTRRSYGMVIGDDFLGAGSSSPPRGPEREKRERPTEREHVERKNAGKSTTQASKGRLSIPPSGLMHSTDSRAFPAGRGIP